MKYSIRNAMRVAAAACALTLVGTTDARAQDHATSGAFTTPAGAMDAAPLAPGQHYTFTFTASPGARLSLATMFVQSNDWFYAPDEEGVALFDMGAAVTGDVTSHFRLWDAGTEADEEPGAGPHQAPRQGGPDMGMADTHATVRHVSGMDAGVPPTTAVLQVTIAAAMGGDAMHGTRFTVTVRNAATDTKLETMRMGMQPILLSPGVWVIHEEPAPFFRNGEADWGRGLEALAEDGNPGPLARSLSMHEEM